MVMNQTSGVLQGKPPAPAPSHLAEHEDDENGAQRGYVKGTDFSLPYFSRWSRMHDTEVNEGLLRHVNCGYLSTQDVPPTLLALKQHAQSLCVLIQALNPTLKSAEILTGDPTTTEEQPSSSSKKSDKKKSSSSGADPLTVKYERNDAFDFVADLTVPYANDDPNHNKPLTGLVNEVRQRHEAFGTNYHCPFAESKPPRAKGEAQKPYANHHALIMHANACLERLDHEFSSTGGLLSLLPTGEEHDEANLANARNCLLGQWLLFTQHLVGRTHELERSYGNALDALAGEASIPHQYMAALGPDGRAGRAIAFPQDRWVLVNAGDDVFENVHRILDKQEALAQAKEKTWRQHGVLGDFVWKKDRSGKDYARGIIPVTIPTRYYRLAGQGRNTLFVLPAWESHPGVAHTREMEARPTIVSSVQPRYPPRATELEKQYDARIRAAQDIEMENIRAREEAGSAAHEIQTLALQNEQLAKTRDALMLAVGEGPAQLAVKVNEERERAQKAEKEAKKVAHARDRAVREADRLREQVEALMMEAATLKARLRAA